MRIAIIRRYVHGLAGVEGYALRLIYGLKKMGLEVGVIAEKFMPENGVKFYPVRCSSILKNITFNRLFQEILKRERFDIVHSLERTWPQDIYRAGEGCHIEFIKTLPLKEKLNPKNLLTLYAERKTFLHSRYVMANSERVKREIIRHYNIQENRIVVIYTGVDIEKFNPKVSTLRRYTRKEMGLGEKDFIILFIGSGFRRKGLLFLLKGFARLDIPYAKLLIAGKGNASPYMRLADALGIRKKIRFLGLVKDIVPLYGASDLLVLPSLYEPFSNVCLEAMACGVPVLTSRINGISEILEDGLGNLIIENPFNAEEIACKITMFASEDLRRDFSIKVRQRVEQFSFSSHLNDVVRLYELVLKEKGNLPCSL